MAVIAKVQSPLLLVACNLSLIHKLINPTLQLLVYCSCQLLQHKVDTMTQVKLDIIKLADQVQYVTCRQPCLHNTGLLGLHMSNYIDAQCAHSRIITQVVDNNNDSTRVFKAAWTVSICTEQANEGEISV